MKKLLLLTAALLMTLTMTAQVTTSSIAGTVTDNRDNSFVIGATVKALHIPSGAAYYGVTNANGHYSITGMKAGGPYEVEFSYIGYQPTEFTDIQLVLGQNTIIDAIITEDSKQLQEVQVVASRRNTMRADRSGAVTSMNLDQMNSVPTISRSMTDLMRMTPQSSSSSGVSIGGGNFRQSNVTIDGASFNNAFGLSLGATPLPGGGTPISLDALEQMTVSVTPYDVRQSGFTGGGINAVTRSGTNQFKGSVYTYITSTSLKGSRVGDTSLPVTNGRNDTYGITFSGPIIKNKLFFFLNGEIEDNRTTGPTAHAGDGGNTFTNTSRRPQLSELLSLSDYLRRTYGIETGDWQDYNVKTPAYRFLARLDWNINDSNTKLPKL